MNKFFNRIAKAALGAAFILVAGVTFAQSAYEGIRYQAVLRNSSGVVVASQPVNLRFTIYQKGDLGSGYIESHSTNTNVMGLVNLTIGDGTAEQNTFSSIDWGKDPGNPYFLKVEFSDNGGSTYLTFGESQLRSVPYAMYAKNVENADDADADPENEIQDLLLTGNILEITNNGSPSLIDLTKYLDNTDAQLLSIDNDTLKLTNGGQVYVGYFDQSGELTSLEAKVRADSIFLSNRIDGIANGLSTRIENDSILLNTLSSNVAAGAFKDSSSTNELNTSVLLSGTDLNVTDAGGTETADLSSLEESQAIIDTATNLRSDLATKQALGDTAQVLRDLINNKPAKGIDSVLANGNDAADQSIVNLKELRIGTSGQSGNTVSIVDSTRVVVGRQTAVNVRSLGTTTSTAGQIGIRSEISGTNGENVSIEGVSNGTSSGSNAGVGGYASNADTNQAVKADATGGVKAIGVDAKATGGTAQNVGLKGTALNGGGALNHGVQGVAQGGAVQNIGVEGRVIDNNTSVGNRGVFGWITTTGSWNEGVAGFADGASTNSNTGVYGQGTNSTGVNRGTHGTATVPTSGINIGAGGNASFGTSQTIGLRGTASGNAGSNIVYGVYGQVDSSGNIKRGVVGNLIGPVDNSDAAIYGIAQGQGTNTAIYGRANNTNNTSDTNIAIVGQAVNAMVNISGWFKEGNVFIDDTLFLKEGAQQNYVLTAVGSDGRAEWMPAQSDDDADSTNELITSFTLSNDTLRITEAGVTSEVVFSRFVDTTTFNNYKTQLAQQMQGLDSRIVADSNRLVTLTDDVNTGAYKDSSSTNELNTGVNLTGTDLNIIDAGGTQTVDLSSLDQSSSITGLDTRIENDSIRLNGYDARILADSNRLVTLTDDVNTGAYKDSSSTNELNTGANLTGTDLNIIDAGGTQTVDLSPLDQSSSITGLGTRIINDSNRLNGIDARIVADSNRVNGFDSRIVTDSNRLNGIDTRIVADSNRLVTLTDDINTGAYKDSSSTNELNTGMNLTGTNLNIIDAGGTQTADLSSLDQSSSVTGLDNRIINDSLRLNGIEARIVADSNRVNGFDSRIVADSNRLDDTAAAIRAAIPEALWSENGDTIYVDNGEKVGIGTDAPDHNLTINVTDSVGVGVFVNADTKSSGVATGVFSEIDGGASGTLEKRAGEFSAVGTAANNIGIFGSASGADTNYAGYFEDGNVAIENRLIVGGDNVGLDSSLNVEGGINTDYLRITEGNPQSGKVLTAVDTDGKATWQAPAAGYTTKGIDSVLVAGSDAAGDSIVNLGALGIGTTTPASALEIESSSLENTTFTGSASKGTFLNIRNTAGGTAYKIISTGSGNFEGAKKLIFGVGSSLNSNNVHSLVIDSNKIGIGTFNPSELLDVNGKAHIDTLNINGKYDLPYDVGNVGEVLTLQSGGVSTWKPISVSQDDSTRIAFGTSKISLSSSPGRIDFFHDDTSYFYMDKGRLHTANNGRSVFIGFNAGINDDYSANQNVFIGYDAGGENTVGSNNAAVGAFSFNSNVGGGNNAAFGFNSLSENTNGDFNSAFGSRALQENIGGGSNSAFGMNALRFNTTGNDNSAFGFGSLLQNTSGSDNVAIGKYSMRLDSTGSNNIAIGSEAMYEHKTGNNNIAIGTNSLYNNETGSDNIVIGNNAASNELGSDKLYIENSNSPTPLIYGDFASDSLRFNGAVSIKDGFFVDDANKGDGKVLTSDANGKATWQAVSSDTALVLADSSRSSYSLFDNDTFRLFSNNSEWFTIKNGRVGINMNNPVARLCLWDTVSSAGGKVGINAQVHSINAQDTAVGIQSYVTGDATNKYGIYSKVYGGPTSSRYYGFFGDVVSNGSNSISYGSFNRSKGAGSFSVFYGSYNEANGTNVTTAINYGIYATAFGGLNNYAGYFDKGNVRIGDSLAIGKVDPARRLDVVGDAYVDSLWTDSIVIGSGSNQFGIGSTSGSNGDVLTYNGGVANWSTPSSIWDTNSTTAFQSINKNLQVGVGDSALSSLQIDSNFHFGSFNIGGNPFSYITQNIYFDPGTGYKLSNDGMGYLMQFAPDGIEFGIVDSAAAGSSISDVDYGFSFSDEGLEIDGPLILNDTTGTQLKISTPDSIKGSGYTISFPDTIGTSGQVLGTSGSGQLVWMNDTLVCPTSMEKVNDNYCIDKVERTAAIWFVADSICVDAGYELASYSDWYGAATQAAAGNITLTNMENNFEWTSNISQNNVMVVGDPSGGGLGRRQRAFRDPEVGIATYRCVYRK